MPPRRRVMVVSGLAIAAVAALAALGWWGSESRSLGGGYVLRRFDENGKFYLTRRLAVTDGGGVFDGTIERIGWDGGVVLAEVTRIYRGDRDGWYALDVHTGRVRGPLAQAQITDNPSLRSIRCVAPEAR